MANRRKTIVIDKKFQYQYSLLVVAVAILALISLTAYADYKIRAKVTEGVGFMAKAKTSVSETYFANGAFPINNVEAGLAPPDSYDYTYFSRLEVGSIPVPGSIPLTVNVPALGTDNLLQMVPVVVNGELDWECRPAVVNGIAPVRVPAICRA